MKIQARKKDHIDLCLNQDVDSATSGFWDAISLPHCACPNLSLAEVSLSTEFLGYSYGAPLLISSMTGGTPEGLSINLRLARLSESAQIPMGVGSQRIAIENSDRLADFSRLKREHPNSRLWANLGLVQLNYGVTADDIHRICDSIEAEAIIFHLNPLQEALQSGGDTDFRGLIQKLESLRSQIKIPIVIKETGCGIDTTTAQNFVNAGVDAFDVAGMGGTHWGYIETLRQGGEPQLGQWFRSWGLPTPSALTKIREQHPSANLVASGGIRHGVDAAKALYLGADFAALAKPYLRAAANHFEQLEAFHLAIEKSLKIALFCTNHASIESFKNHQKNTRSLSNV